MPMLFEGNDGKPFLYVEGRVDACDPLPMEKRPFSIADHCATGRSNAMGRRFVFHRLDIGDGLLVLFQEETRSRSTPEIGVRRNRIERNRLFDLGERIARAGCMLILIENTVCLNAGDAAIALAIMRILRRAFGEKSEFVVFDSNPEVAARYYPDIRFRPLTTTLTATPSISLPFVGKRFAIRLRRNIDRLKKHAD